MSIRIGIVGVGGMGTFHFRNYSRIAGAEVVALCDIDPKKISGDFSGININIGDASADVDITKLKMYSDADLLFQDPDVDVIDITLPTFLHADFAIRAMKAGKDVICEKPMALTPEEGEKMVACAKQTGKKLFIAQCIRFWPQYAVAREIVQSKKYGEVTSGYFVRRSGLPKWSWENWLLTPERSGGCVLDMHIHDSDFVLYCFGMPNAVTSFGTKGDNVLNDDVLSTFHYDNGALIVAEGGWSYKDGFPFVMIFTINMEKATLRFEESGKLMLYVDNEEPLQVEHDNEDGYFKELTHFIDCINAGKLSDVCPPSSACQTLKLVYGEIESMKTGKTVKL